MGKILFIPAFYILFHIKKTNNEGISQDIVCIFEIIYVITTYHYRAGNKVLFYNNYYSSYKCWTKPSEL